MRTLLIAHALLLMTDPDTAGGIPAEPNPNTNDSAGAAPVAATAAPNPVDLTELDEDFHRRIEAERAEFQRIRELTPIQEVELRPCVGASHLGVIIGTPDGIRCLSLADWRTDRLALRAGDTAQIVVLAGEGLKTWEFYRQQEATLADRPPLGAVKTVSLEPAAAAALVGGLAANLQSGGADSAGAAPARDPLEETQPAIPGTNGLGSETKPADPETATAQGS